MNYRKLMLSLALCLPLSALAKQILVQSPHLSLVLNADEGKQPEYVYFGSKLSGADLQTLQKPMDGRMDAYPAYGLDCPDRLPLPVVMPTATYRHSSLSRVPT